MSLLVKLHDLEEQVRQLKAGDTSHSDDQPTQQDLTVALYSVKNTIESGKQTQTQAKIDRYYDEFRTNAPAPSEFTLGDVIEYAVNFVEQHAPSLMKILNVLAEDSSPFKLNTCIYLIVLILPAALRMTKDILISLVNTVVKIKNTIHEQIASIETAVVPTVTARMGGGKKRSLISKIRGK